MLRHINGESLTRMMEGRAIERVRIGVGVGEGDLVYGSGS